MPRKALGRWFVAALALAPLVPAQWRSEPGSLHTSKATVADDLGADPLEVARRATEAGDLDRAIETYQEILDRLGDLVFRAYAAPRLGTETERVLDGDRFVGLRDRVHELLRALPNDGFAKYVAREGPKAEAELARATASRDEEALRRLGRTRRLTPAGGRALAAAADLAFEDGRFADAASRAESLVSEAQPDEDDLRRRMLLRAGLAYVALGDRAALADLRARVSASDAAAPAVVGGSPTTVGAALDGLVARLGPPAAPSPPGQPAFGARPWPPQPLAVQPSENRWDERWYSFGQPIAEPPTNYAPVVPLVSDATIYVNDGLELSARSLYTGRTLWKVEGRADRFQGRRNWNVTYEVVRDGDLVFGYLEDEPQVRADPRHSISGYVPIETIPTRKLYAVDARNGEVRWTHARFDGARTAEERAFLAKLTVNTAPLVVGDRLYVGGCFYHGGFRHWLCCFDRATGAIVWRTFVALGQAEQNMFGNAVKDCAPGLVGHRRGLLAYATNVGVAAAVDAATGAPRWVSAYLQELIPSVEGPGAVERMPGWAPHRPLFVGDRIFMGPADSLAFLGFDAKTGEVFPLRDDAKRESALRTRLNGFRHVVPAGDDVVVLAGAELAAWDLAAAAAGREGAFKWRASPPAAGGVRTAVDGLPAALGDRVWFSTRQSGRGGRERSKLYAVDVRTGRYVEEATADGYATGNVVLAEDAAVIAGGGSGEAYLAAYFDLARTSARVRDAAAQSPGDPLLRLRLGQLRLQAGETAEAVQAFRQALEAATAQGARGESAAAAAKNALFTAYLGLGADFARVGPGLPPSAEERFDLALAHAASPRQRATALFAKLRWAHQAGRAQAVYETADALTRDHADEPAAFDRIFAELLRTIEVDAPAKAGLVATLVAASTAEKAADYPRAVAYLGAALRAFPEEPLVRATKDVVSVWRHCFDAIDAIVKNRGAAAYAKEEAAARAKFAAARDGADLAALQEVVDAYPNSSVAGDARLLRLRRLREAGRTGDALAAVQRELARFGAESPEIVLETARALEAAGFLESARDALAALRARFGPRPIAVGDGASTPADAYVAARLAEPAFVALEDAAPPAVPLGAQAIWTETAAADGGDVELIVPRGRRPADADALAFVYGDGEIRALDLANGRRVWRRAVRNAPSAALWRDGRLVVAAADEIFSLSPKGGEEAWSAKFAEGPPAAIEAAHGKVYALVREPGVARALILRTFDAALGARLRDHRFPLAGYDGDGGPVYGQPSLESDERHLLVRLAAADRGVVLDGLTGATVVAAMPLKASSGTPPMLGPDGLLVSAPSAADLRPTERRLVARRLGTNEDAWTWRAERVRAIAARRVGRGALLIQLKRETGGNRTEDEIVLLDLANGTTLLQKRFAGGEFVDASSPPVLDGELLLLPMRRPGAPGSNFVRAYDVAKDEVRWESVPISGRYTAVRAYAGREHVVATFSADSASPSARSGSVRQGAVRVLDRRTGRVLDEIPIEAARKASDRPDVDLRPGALLIESATGVEARR